MGMKFYCNQNFKFLPFMLVVVKGSVAIIDEFDTALHDILVESLVSALNKDSEGQLILTTHPPHLLVLPATFGLHLLLQTYPYFRALYVISVRRTKSLPTASFRFHLTIDTLAVQLYTSSLPRRVRDFHPLERAHGAQTKWRSAYRNTPPKA
jgi:hypothetical protein